MNEPISPKASASARLAAFRTPLPGIQRSASGRLPKVLQPPTEAWLIRHAESLGNAAHVLQGQEDLPLSPLGHRQARKLAERIVTAHRNRPFAAIYCSDLMRARETADTLAIAIGLPVVTDARLREIDVGRWAGLTQAQIAERFPEEWLAWQSRDPTMRRGGGESYQDAQIRLTPVILELSDRHQHQRVLIVTHGGVLRAYLAGVMGLPLSHLWHLGMSNTSIHRIRPFETAVGGSNPRKGRIVTFNDTAHLDPETGGDE